MLVLLLARQIRERYPILYILSVSDRKDIFMSKQPKVRYFTSESVCAGHPDKICDAISDAILDATLMQDPNSHTAIETIVGANQICLFGEVKTKARVDYEKIVRGTIQELGYIVPAWGFSFESKLTNGLHEQSNEINMGVEIDGAGDQGMMFGYACTDTTDLMPLPIALAHSIAKRIDEVREKQEVNWLRPDGKTQVTIKYEDDVPVSIEKIVVAVAHKEETPQQQVFADIVAHILEPVVSRYGYKLPKKADIIVNGTGFWFIPGPESDAGLTGRKIVVDGYGGYARVGGGAFSGKDPSKVDRSGAYGARYIAKNIVARGLADRCEVALAYVIGKPEPLMQTISTFGTAHASDEEIYQFKDKLLDTSVRGIINTLDLARPIYRQTAAYGHFGRSDFPWEALAKAS